LVAEKCLSDNLNQVQVQYDRFAKERSRLLASLEKNVLSSQSKSHKENSILRLFLIESSGSKFTAGLVFTFLLRIMFGLRVCCVSGLVTMGGRLIK
jgi:hypothetical protein